MPLEFSILRRTIISTTRGDVDYATGMTQLAQTIAAAAETMKRDRGPGWHYLADIRQSTEQRTGDEIWNIARLLHHYRTTLSGKIAIVVTSRHHLEITRMFGTILEHNGMQLRSFPDPEAAHAWLADA